jgi:hypothetical protein
MQTRDFPLLKSLKTATVAPAPLAIRCTSDKTCWESHFTAVLATPTRTQLRALELLGVAPA